MNTLHDPKAHPHPTLSDLFTSAGVSAYTAGSSDATIPDVKITSLTDDSRSLTRGGCFVAVRGTSSDGHAFIEAAARAGAAATVVDRDVRVPEGIVRVRVEDTREALAKLAAAYYRLSESDRSGSSPLRLIGITGTNGKTTVAWLLRSILKAAGHTTALIGTIEYDLITERLRAPLTTPGSLDLCRYLAAARDAGAAYAVLEVSSHALAQRRCDGLTFAAGVFTNLSGDHLDYHGTMERYAAVKRHLFNLLATDGVAVLNHDDPMGRSLAESLEVPVALFSLEGPAAVRASIQAVNAQGSTLVLYGHSFETLVRLPLMGRHNVENALAAAATADALGVGPEAIREGLERVTTVPGRLQRVEPSGWPFSVLIDYAHTDAALTNVLEAVRSFTPARLICVFGCGGDRDRHKRPRMAAVVGRLADVAYVTSDNPRSEDPQQIIEEILPGFKLISSGRAAGRASPALPEPARSGRTEVRGSLCRVEVEADRRRAIEAAIADAQPGDTVLIAGKGHEAYQLVGDSRLPFNDAEVARACLKAEVVAEEVA